MKTKKVQNLVNIHYKATVMFIEIINLDSDGRTIGGRVIYNDSIVGYEEVRAIFEYR